MIEELNELGRHGEEDQNGEPLFKNEENYPDERMFELLDSMVQCILKVQRATLKNRNILYNTDFHKLN
jgi:hypothetical protein